MDKSEQEKARESLPADTLGRRRYTKAFKQSLVQQSREPNTSTSRVAMQAGVNANLLRRWVKQAERAQPGAPALLPVVLADPVRRAATVKAMAVEAAAIEIDVNGARIRLNSRASAEQIAAVVSALRA